MTESELRTLPRKLAQRLIVGSITCPTVDQAEAVILEAIEQTIEKAAILATSHDCNQQADRNCVDDTCGENIAAAIRSLKPAKPEEAKKC